jgi:biotin operon repressor
MYEQTLEIEHRLNDLLRLVEEGRYSTPRLAELLNVSIPTVSRGIRALRSRGSQIASTRLNDGTWCYRIEPSTGSNRPSRVQGQQRGVSA